MSLDPAKNPRTVLRSAEPCAAAAESNSSNSVPSDMDRSAASKILRKVSHLLACNLGKMLTDVIPVCVRLNDIYYI